MLHTRPLDLVLRRWKPLGLEAGKFHYDIYASKDHCGLNPSEWPSCDLRQIAYLLCVPLSSGEWNDDRMPSGSVVRFTGSRWG